MAKKKSTTTKSKTASESKIPTLDTILWNCRDYLRGSASLNDKRDVLLTLVFLRFISEHFEEEQERVRQKYIHDGITDEKVLTNFVNAPLRYAVFVPEKARWDYLMQQPAPKLNNALDEALQAIDGSGEALKGCVLLGLFTSVGLQPSVIKKVMDEINKISKKTYGEEKDLIGHVYEYFLRSFAINATKEEGEFYTPHDIVELIAAFIEPYNDGDRDVTLYDPCCGSGGMFVQCTKFVEEKRGDTSKVNVYGQERDPATFRLAKMNLAMRGISHHLGEKNADTFTNDQHPGLTVDYIMANPPFNLRSWYAPTLSDDPRWADYGTPPEGNANYAWILHILSKLDPRHGVAGFLLANGALGDSDAAEIRQKLIEKDRVEAIIVLPRQLFYTTDISVTLWILNQDKKGGRKHGRQLRDRSGEILLMDLRQCPAEPTKGEQKKKLILTPEIIREASSIYHKWQSKGTDGAHFEAPEYYRSVGLEELKDNDFTLIPSRYIRFVDRDIDLDHEELLATSAATVSDLLDRQERNGAALRHALKELGYDCK